MAPFNITAAANATATAAATSAALYASIASHGGTPFTGRASGRDGVHANRAADAAICAATQSRTFQTLCGTTFTGRASGHDGSNRCHTAQLARGTILARALTISTRTALSCSRCCAFHTHVALAAFPGSRCHTLLPGPAAATANVWLEPLACLIHQRAS